MWSSVSATAKGIYIILEGKLIDHLECSNTWRLCTSVGLDNTSINIRIRNSMETRIVPRNPQIIFNGFPCHIIHSAAQKAEKLSTRDVVLMRRSSLLAFYYWFDRSKKRKINLSNCVFCDNEYIEILKHVSTKMDFETAILTISLPNNIHLNLSNFTTYLLTFSLT